MPQLTDKNDEDLMLLTGKGKKKAFEELVKRHTRPLQNYFYRYFRNIEDRRITRSRFSCRYFNPQNATAG